MITLQNVAALRPPRGLAGISLDWGAGAHAILGAPHDGGPLLLALIAGRARPRAGRIQVLDGAPTDSAIRAQIALVPNEPVLPEALLVRETLVIAAAVRGESPVDARERLATLGVDALAERPVRSLSLPEVRAVALAEAVTSSRVRVLLVEEPFVAMDPRAAGRIPGVLSARTSAGWAVVVATASTRDASEIAGDHVRLVHGEMAARCVANGPPIAGRPRGARLHVALSDVHDARALVAMLAHDEHLMAVEQEAASVTIRGPDRVALARAAARAVEDAGVDVTELRFDHPPLDEAT
ncbi:MAG: ATP-binding cassette domain-containing protein [Polyangiaceae bacterium]